MLDGPSPWRNLLAARVMLTLPLYRPIRAARRIVSPLLMVVCERDEICPASIARRAAELAPNGRAAAFDSSHFEIYFGPLFEAAVGEMLRFLELEVGAAATPAAAVARIECAAALAGSRDAGR
jgi:uncharacterized protein